MSDVKIEKGIPIPPAPRRGRHNMYPWDTMEINDSFVATTNNPSSLVAAAMKRYGRHYLFLYRKIGPKKYRIWRINHEPSID